MLPTYQQTGLVPRLPTAILATGLCLTSAISFETVTIGRREVKQLSYLARRD